MTNLGDIKLGSTVDLKFTTATTTGAPTTLSGSPAVAVYVDNGTTEITAGVTLTVDFDSRTGLNNVRLVLTSANGYTRGTNCQVVITAGTVGGTSVVGYVVGSFSIDARSPMFSGVVTSGTLSGTHSTVSADLGTNAPSVNIAKQTVFFPSHGLARVVASYNTGTGVATWDDAVDVTLANSDPWILFATAPSVDAAAVRAAVGLASANLDTQIGNVQTDTNDIQSRLPAALVGGRMNSNVAAVNNIEVDGAGTVGDPWGPA